MPLVLDLPPIRALGSPGDFSDANLFRAAFLQVIAAFTQMEADIEEIRTTYLKGRVSVTEPAHDGSQEQDENWVQPV